MLLASKYKTVEGARKRADATLADIRHTIREYSKGRTDLDIGELIDLIEGLDDWITH